jgi:hypothetical protein
MARASRQRQTIAMGDVAKVKAGDLVGASGRDAIGHAAKLFERIVEILQPVAETADERAAADAAAKSLRRRLG